MTRGSYSSQSVNYFNSVSKKDQIEKKKSRTKLKKPNEN